MSAREAYRNHLETMREQLAKLQGHLNALENEKQIDWCNVGDVAHVNEVLGQAAAFLDQSEE